MLVLIATLSNADKVDRIPNYSILNGRTQARPKQRWVGRIVARLSVGSGEAVRI